MDEELQDSVYFADDPRLPPVIREHGARFRNPCFYVVDLGFGEYLLFAEDGELLDAVTMKK